MKVLVWVEPATWPAVIDAARALSHEQITLIAVDDPGEHPLPELFGRGRGADSEVASIAAAEAEALLAQASEALGVDCATRVLHGRTERVVTEAAEDVGLLVLARDGDRSRLGPHSLGRHTRFVIDHAPCRVLLIWPENPPALATMPAPPAHDRPH